MGRIKTSNKELKTTILGLKEDMFDENLIKQLLLYFPSNEEVEQLQNTEHVTGRGEEFFKECVDSIEIMKESLYYLYFVIKFKNQNIDSSLNSLKKYYTVLLKSNALKKFLAVSLYAGNYLNQDNFLRNAEGFTMESIYKILELKGKNNKSLISLILGKIDYKDLVMDIDSFRDVNNVNFEVLCIEMEELKSNYMNAAGASSEKICEKIDEILPEYESICSKYDNVVKLRSECSDYFGTAINEEFNNLMAYFSNRLKMHAELK